MTMRYDSITLKNRQKKKPVSIETGKTRSLKLETLTLISTPI
ncbi:hypothetical protein P6F46_28230 (plasmid) [Bacillus shihchuchen]|uniref:Uncharacterized protein n=1 Tax=Bacillus shihchuchen TaxID=3036942 RepID=A0ABT7KZ55_9BACI|nr:hypothetical protein [Bacillus shihchuchen]